MLFKFNDTGKMILCCPTCGKRMRESELRTRQIPFKNEKAVLVRVEAKDGSDETLERWVF